MANNDRLIAYFSMEVALHPEIPTYSGGLGVLAGDTLRAAADADSLYRQLEETIIPLFYGNRDQFIATMRSAIALNRSFFNTQRMVLQYVSNAYFG